MPSTPPTNISANGCQQAPVCVSRKDCQIRRSTTVGTRDAAFMVSALEKTMSLWVSVVVRRLGGGLRLAPAFADSSAKPVLVSLFRG
jgi:hypothetical protein